MQQYRVPPLPPTLPLPPLPQSAAATNFSAHARTRSSHRTNIGLATTTATANMTTTATASSSSASAHALLYGPDCSANITTGSATSIENLSALSLNPANSANSEDSVASRWTMFSNEPIPAIKSYLSQRPKQNHSLHSFHANNHGVPTIPPSLPAQSAFFPPSTSSSTTATLPTSAPLHMRQLGHHTPKIPNATLTTAPPPAAKTLPETNPHGILGLVNMLRTAVPDANMSIIGFELNSLGFSVSDIPLHKTFVSPYAEIPQQLLGMTTIVPKHYSTPPYYNVPMSSSVAQRLGLLSDEALLYIFYSMPRDRLQSSAAAELFSRSWRYHKLMRLWVAKDESFTSISKTMNSERGIFLVFDVSIWEKSRRDLTIMYEALEEDQAALQILPHPPPYIVPPAPSVVAAVAATQATCPMYQNLRPPVIPAVNSHTGGGIR